MGRKYFCDYCDKRIQNNSDIIRKHNEGLPHIRAKAEHFEQFKDLEQILSESKHKTPCRSLKEETECMFGVLCRFRHYTAEQMREMYLLVDRGKLVERKKSNRLSRNMRNVETRTDNFVRKRCDRNQYEPEKLPPSLQYKPIRESNKVEPGNWG